MERNREIAGGKYRLTDLLGEGAFSRVYLAEDRRGKQYACKISEKKEILAREAGYQKEIRHPLFPDYVEYGEAEESGWLVMEYIHGETLERILRRERAFPEKRAAYIGRILAAGLRYLQERPIPLLFRDLKPSNVLLEGEEERVRLLDLGCVCPAGRPQSAAGTPGFGAPEQFAAGSRQDITVDVYGLGRVLLAMTGEHCRGPLRKVIGKCIRELPEERLPDMRVTEELLAVCCGEGAGRGFTDVQKAYLTGKITVSKNIVIL